VPAAGEDCVDPKTLSDRIGHANTSVTLQTTATDHTAGTRMAQALGDLIQSAMTPDGLHEPPVIRRLVRNHPGDHSETAIEGESTES
jgi:hypothetical protein